MKMRERIRVNLYAFAPSPQVEMNGRCHFLAALTQGKQPEVPGHLRDWVVLGAYRDAGPASGLPPYFFKRKLG